MKKVEIDRFYALKELETEYHWSTRHRPTITHHVIAGYWTLYSSLPKRVVAL
jgi:hypothetical protein